MNRTLLLVAGVFFISGVGLTMLVVSDPFSGTKVAEELQRDALQENLVVSTTTSEVSTTSQPVVTPKPEAGRQPQTASVQTAVVKAPESPAPVLETLDTTETPSAQIQSTRGGGITAAQVAEHDTSASCWTVINGNVYDVTNWIPNHPGGKQAILSLCGKDGSSAFNNQHDGQSKPEDMLSKFKIGTLATAASKASNSTSDSLPTAQSSGDDSDDDDESDDDDDEEEDEDDDEESD